MHHLETSYSFFCPPFQAINLPIHAMVALCQVSELLSSLQAALLQECLRQMHLSVNNIVHKIMQTHKFSTWIMWKHDQYSVVSYLCLELLQQRSRKSSLHLQSFAILLVTFAKALRARNHWALLSWGQQICGSVIQIIINQEMPFCLSSLTQRPYFVSHVFGSKW